MEALYATIDKAVADPSFGQEIITNPKSALAKQGIKDPESIAQLKNVVASILRGQEHEAAFKVINKASTDPVFAKELMDNADDVCHGNGITQPAVISTLQELSGWLAYYPRMDSQQVERATEQYALDMEQMKSGYETMKTFEQGLRDSVEQLRKGFHLTSIMYNIGFYVGIALIVGSVVLAITSSKALIPLAFGGIGALDVITYFISKPPAQLERSRADLAQLQAAYYNWFTDKSSWETFLWRVYQTPDLKEYLEYLQAASNRSMEGTAKTMKLIETYCEFSSKNSLKGGDQNKSKKDEAGGKGSKQT